MKYCAEYESQRQGKECFPQCNPRKERQENPVVKDSFTTQNNHFHYFKCKNERGQEMTLQIEALNAENAEIIFKHRYPNYSYEICL